jgi:peptide/nickel transport system substrate-binding protein
MKKHRTFGLAAVAAAAAVGLGACGTEEGGDTAAPATAAYNSGVNGTVRPSGATGGTIVFNSSSVPDSTDPGNTYYAHQWNVIRLYGRTLVTYKSVPGSGGNEVVPDLADSLGKISNNGLTWTYHLKPNLRYEDGTKVTSQDVKYAVERSYAKDVLPNGPGYFSLLLKDPGYPGPYKDRSAGKLGLKGVTPPDARTIVFHLVKPFADFNYVVALPQTVPVPPEKDKGANYQLHPMSTGPYKFESYQLDKQFTLVPNPNWSAASDPQRKQLASRPPPCRPAGQPARCWPSPACASTSPSPAASSSATRSARSRPWTAWTSASPKARHSAWSANRAAARPPPAACLPGSSSPPAGGSSSMVMTSPTSAPGRCARCGAASR